MTESETYKWVNAVPKSNLNPNSSNNQSTRKTVIVSLTSMLYSTITIFATIAAACGVPAHLANRELPTKTAITNVHVWNGAGFSAPSTVVIIGSIITNANAVGAETTVDGKGGYLMPGYIDTHCHVTSCSYLSAMRANGITTALDMGTFPVSAVTACRAAGVTDIYGTGAAGTVNGTAISNIPGFPQDSFLVSPAAAKTFVANRIEEGASWIKVFLDPLGPDEETLSALVNAAHAAGKQVVTHAPAYADYSEAQTAGADIPCHVPLDKPLDSTSIKNLTLANRHVVPTLIMMQSIVNNTGAPYIAYTAAAEGSVTSMNAAGVPIAVGTDANTSPYVPANPPFGISLHEELALLVAAGLTPTQALQGATSVAAHTFGLYDRGSISPGLRADLVLLSADPTVNIANSKSIEYVWLAGVLFTAGA
jgi:imidazolonepropionase-like amidohydrolase